MTDRPIYFAYGSNLDLEGKLRRWAPTAELIGIAKLPRRRLAFTRQSPRWGARAADILPHKAASTWGALFAVEPPDVAGIDACERAPAGYRRIALTAEGTNGPVPVFSYEVVDRHLPDAPPARAYLETIIRGAEKVGLPNHWIKMLKGLETEG